MKTAEFLDWIVEIDFQHYKTEATDSYKPRGNSHFYLKGSGYRFTSGELIEIFNETSDDKLKDKWVQSLLQHCQWTITELQENNLIETDEKDL